MGTSWLLRDKNIKTHEPAARGFQAASHLWGSICFLEGMGTGWHKKAVSGLFPETAGIISDYGWGNRVRMRREITLWASGRWSGA